MTIAEPVSTSAAANAGPLPAAQRLVSLDAFRGLTIALMILVNNPGSWSHIYAPLRHAEWHGWTPTDLVFPFFLFIVGVAIPFAQATRLRRLPAGRSRAALVPGIIRRATLLFALGLLLASIPTRLSPGNGILDPANLRIMGVLQRIALCYLPAALLALYAGWRFHLAAAIALMTLYSVLMLAVPVPGYGTGDLSLQGNLAAYVDGKVFGTHNYQNPPTHPHYWEPEGLLSTLPAIATTLLGLLCGLWLRSPRSDAMKVVALLLAGAAATALGYLLGELLMPINKGLWTPSYTIFTAGLAAVTLAACYWLIDMLHWKAWAKPFVIFGMNAIAIFVLSGAIGRLLLLIKFEIEGKPVALRTLMYGRLFQSLGLSPLNTSLLHAVLWVAVMFVIAWVMYRRRIFLKV